jgi:uncharacterized protein YndB with AHSA1/START domain
MSELTYRRVHRAPRDLVFECMTTPEHLSHFWGPVGTSTPRERIVVDLRLGGAFETVMVGGDGSEYAMRAVYVEVSPPDRIAWRDLDNGMITTVTFVAMDDRTEVVIHQADVSAQMLTPEARAGFATSLDRFDSYLAERSGASG